MIKPEPTTVQGVCVVEGCTNLQSSRGGGFFKPRCKKHGGGYGRLRRQGCRQDEGYKLHRKTYCEKCGPDVSYHPCQLDVDHIDADHSNDAEDNLQTLCANCHRLKTYNERHQASE